MPNPTDPTFLALDLETTGLSARDGRIVEVGAARFDAWGRDLGHFQALVNPRRPVSDRARAVHGIADAELAAAPGADVVLPRFLAWLDEAPVALLLAHNASFDASFLGAELARIGRGRPDLAIADTLSLARRLRPDAPNHRLDTLAALYGLDPQGPHRALADSRRVVGLWLALTGGKVPEPPPISYPVRDPAVTAPIPSGWGELERAVASGHRVRIIYGGGTRGSAPREIAPRTFRLLGGVPYVIALCTLDAREKAFRLDRVLSLEVLDP